MPWGSISHWRGSMRCSETTTLRSFSLKASLRKSTSRHLLVCFPFLLSVGPGIGAHSQFMYMWNYLRLSITPSFEIVLDRHEISGLLFRAFSLRGTL